jgi:superfamily II DNA/RNA helicase
VNLVVSMDLPADTATYLHRVGRAGRFGTHGLAVTVAAPDELERLHAIDDEAGHPLVWVSDAAAVPIPAAYAADVAAPDERDLAALQAHADAHTLALATLEAAPPAPSPDREAKRARRRAHGSSSPAPPAAPAQLATPAPSPVLQHTRPTGHFIPPNLWF